VVTTTSQINLSTLKVNNGAEVGVEEANRRARASIKNWEKQIFPDKRRRKCEGNLRDKRAEQ